MGPTEWTLDALTRFVESRIPGAYVDQDNEGQVVIYTNLMWDSVGPLWELDDEDEEDDDVRP